MSLRDRVLYNTRLSGTVPDMAKLTALQYVYLHNLRLHGEIPDLSACSSLISFRLTNNSFTRLPAALPTTVSHVYFDANPLNSSADELAALLRSTTALHAFSVGMMTVPLDLEATRVAPPPACQVGRDCSWVLQLQDTDGEPALTGSLISNLYIGFNCSCDRRTCGDTRDTRDSCQFTANMTDNADGTFTGTVPSRWVQSKGQHSFRFFHDNDEFRPSYNFGDSFEAYDSLRAAHYGPVTCTPATHTIPDATGSKCVCKSGFVSDGDGSGGVCLRQCTNGTVVVDDGNRCQCPPNTYDTRHAGVVLCATHGWTAHRRDFANTVKQLSTGSTCVSCPVECASCADGIANLSVGWRLNGTSEEQMQRLLRGSTTGLQPQFAYQCPSAGYETVTCPPMLLSTATNASSVACREHHTGPLCALCEPSFSRRSSDGACAPCDDTNVFQEHFNLSRSQFIEVAVIFSVSLCLLLYWQRRRIMRAKQQVYSLAKIALGLGQVLALLKDVLNLLFPPPPRRAMSYAALVSADLHTLYEFDCNGWNWYGTWILTVLGLPCIGFGLVAAWHVRQRYCKAKHTTVDATGALFFVILVLYPRVSSSILSAFRCRALGEQMQVLEVDYSVSCLTDEYRSYRVMAWILLVLWPVGIPICLLCLLSWHRRRIVREFVGAATESCVEAADEGRSIAQHTKTQLMQRYAFCLDDYRPEAWWFEPVDMLRKLALSGLLQFVQRGTASQVLVGCCISFASFGVHVRLLPYREAEANLLKVCAEAVLFLTFLISFILRVLPRVEMYEPVGAEAYGYLLLSAFGVFAALFVALIARQIYRRRRFQQGLAAFARSDFEGDVGAQELAMLTRSTPQQPETEPGEVPGRPGDIPSTESRFTMEEPLIEPYEAAEEHPRAVTRSPLDRLYMWVASQ